MNRRALFLALAFVLAGCAAHSPIVPKSTLLERAKQYPEYPFLEQEFDAARVRNVPFLAPGPFRTARVELEKVRAAVQSGKANSLTNAAILRAREALRVATHSAEKARGGFAELARRRRQVYFYSGRALSEAQKANLPALPKVSMAE
jgi:hypothetical protein